MGEKAFTIQWARGKSITIEQTLQIEEDLHQYPSSKQPKDNTPTYPAGLTKREVEILRLVAEGLTDAQIANKLILSPRTINWYLTAIYSKIHVSSRSAATRYAIEKQLL